MNDAELVQRSPEWLQARVGSLGASQIGKALGETVKRSKPPEALMYEIAAERLTSLPAKQDNAMRWGVDHESDARSAYAFLTNAPVVEVGLIRHPTIPNTHASVDSLVGDDGCLEMKCPTSAVHLKTLLTNAVPEDHLPQCYWAMACTGRAFCDFVSYDPRFKDHRLQFFQKRVLRDDKIIESMETQARAFLAELEDKLKALEERYPVEAA